MYALPACDQEGDPEGAVQPLVEQGHDEDVPEVPDLAAAEAPTDEVEDPETSHATRQASPGSESPIDPLGIDEFTLEPRTAEVDVGNAEYTFEVSCLNNAQCDGICFLEQHPYEDCNPFGCDTQWATTGHCGLIVCDEQSDCPSEESCIGGICTNPCSSHSDCETGQECNGSLCVTVPRGDWDYCLAGGCERGEGDCDGSSQCAGSLSCRNNIGAQWGYGGGVDVCDFPQGHGSFCSSEFQCGWGEGDCDNNSHCAAPMACKHNVGSQFGFASWVDVCTPFGL